MTTTLELRVRKIQWFCQLGEGFCMHVFSSRYKLSYFANRILVSKGQCYKTSK